MPRSSFKDFFSSGAAGYAAFRPRYPAELFAFVAALPAGHELAWDCATGNGQAAVPLAEHFENVIASDASAAQVAHARPHARVHYTVALADRSGIAPGAVNLVTVAQSLHWLPLSSFFAEVRRVLAPGGGLAVWCYNRLTIDRWLDEVIERYYSVTCGPYWAPERALVDAGYRTVAIPFLDEVEAPPLAIESALTLGELAGYLRSWSATRNLAAATGQDPVLPLCEELLPLWGPPDARRLVRWPLHVRAGRFDGP